MQNEKKIMSSQNEIKMKRRMKSLIIISENAILCSKVFKKHVTLSVHQNTQKTQFVPPGLKKKKRKKKKKEYTE